MFGFFTREPIVGHRELRHHHVLQYQESTSTLLLYDDFSLDVPTHVLRCLVRIPHFRANLLHVWKNTSIPSGQGLPAEAVTYPTLVRCETNVICHFEACN